MGTTYTDYTRRLPYAWAWDPETRTEYLLHRGYHAIARRPAAEPLAAEYLPGVWHPDHAYKGFFYTDRNPPGEDKETLARCEHILVHFLSGHDVRKFLSRPFGGPARVNTPPPKVNARYVETARRKRLNRHGSYLTRDEILQMRLEKVGHVENPWDEVFDASDIYG